MKKIIQLLEEILERLELSDDLEYMSQQIGPLADSLDRLNNTLDLIESHLREIKALQ